MIFNLITYKNKLYAIGRLKRKRIFIKMSLAKLNIKKEEKNYERKYYVKQKRQQCSEPMSSHLTKR